MESLYQVALYNNFVSGLALIMYMVFGLMVGRARAKYGVEAPATTGNEEFERYYRVHQNTLEQLVVFIPSLWLFGLFVQPQIGAAIGLLWIVGRIIYARAYLADPESRGTGMIISFSCQVVLVVGVILMSAYQLLLT